MAILDKIKSSNVFIGLAPMDGITDLPFRLIVKRNSDVDIMFTEFAHVIPLCDYFENVSDIIAFKDEERPVVAQLFGSEPEYFYKAALIVLSIGYDGVDINMGCSDKRIVKSGGGAALIGEERKALKIAEAVRKARDNFKNNCVETRRALSLQVKSFRKKYGIKSISSNPTVSIKTRIGIENDETESWCKILNKTKVDFISIHGRTLKQKYKGRADWNVIKKASGILDMPLLGNGDVQDRRDVKERIKKYNVDGVLIGRAAWGNPFVFSKKKVKFDAKLRKEIALEHIKLFRKYKDVSKYYEIKKHLARYLSNFEESKKYRTECMKGESLAQIERIIKQI